MGRLTYYDSDADETVVLVADHHTSLHQVQIENVVAAEYFVHFFDAASVSDVTLGTTAPKFTAMAERGDATILKSTTHTYPDGGIDFQLGIVVAVKTVATTAGTTGPSTDPPLTIVYG